MEKYKNESVIDRMIRAIVGELLLFGAYFWLGGVLQMVVIALGIVAIVTAITGFCGLYKIIGISTLPKEQKDTSLSLKVVFSILFLLIAVGGSYASNFFSKKIFLDDYSRMNNYYKQTLFYTGQENREASISNYDKLVSEYSVFYKKYSSYHPYVFKFDKKFN